MVNKTTKAVLIITAITLCALCVGSCFALYSVGTTDVEVSISANYVSSWTLDESAYYVVGTFNGGTTDNWSITSANVKLDGTPTDGNTAQREDIQLTAGDELKVMKGNGDWLGSWSSATAQFTNTDGQIHINTTGTYGIYVKYEDSNWHFYIAYKG